MVSLEFQLYLVFDLKKVCQPLKLQSQVTLLNIEQKLKNKCLHIDK